MTKQLFSLLLLIVLCGCATTPAEHRRREIEHKLDTMVIPEIDLRAAHIIDATTFLTGFSQMAENDPSGRGISIVVFPQNRFSPGVLVGPLSIFARNVSMREALNIICEYAGYNWSVEDSIVKVRGKTGTAEAVSCEESPSRVDEGFKPLSKLHKVVPQQESSIQQPGSNTLNQTKGSRQ